MKKLFLLMLPLVALTFNACDKGDDNGGDDNGNETIIGKLVKTINYDDGDDIYNFTYDSQNRLSKVTIDGYELRYSYTSNSITESADGFILTYALDNNGYVAEEELHRLGGNSGENDFTTHTYSDGHITKSESDNYTTVYVWDDGNMIQAARERYTYNNVENKLNLNIFEVLVWDYPFMEEFCKLKGASPKNYPIGVTEVDESGNTYTTSVTYDFDTEGYPTEITVTYNNDEHVKIEITYY